MALTTEQRDTLKAAILADPALVPWTTGATTNNNGLVDAMNAASNPAFIVWRTTVPVNEYRDALVWTEVDGLTVGKARIWDWVTGGMTLPIEASKPAVRQGLADCWAAITATRPALLAVAKRTATRAEGLLATGTGSDASPGTLTFEGNVTLNDILAMAF